ncbi:MAG: sigma-70 family RNA polymerase sigma factor [Acidobacteria bacterium]|nr:sigma-70 family RNA polymerase sigma factor [Acidobacteriota bacterium]
MDAAAELYDSHAAQVYTLGRRLLRDPRDAEDIVQEVFSQAWRAAGRYHGDRGSVAGWLLMMTRTRALDRLRARRARPDSGPSRSPDVLPAVQPHPHDLRAADEQASLVRDALGTLPDTQRAPLELAYYEGLTQAEIAERLAHPLGTSKTRMRAALGVLRERLRT